MDKNELLLEPLKGYCSAYKEAFRENATKYFDELTKTANVDIEKNEETVKAYRDKLPQITDAERAMQRATALRTFLIVLMVIFGVVGLVCMLIEVNVGHILILIGCIGIDALFLYLILKKINPSLKSSDARKAKLQGEADQLLENAYREMATLNALYDWGMPGEIVNRTIPLIEWDKHFDAKKYRLLHEKYGLSHNESHDTSTFYCLSGSVLGNPFLLCRDYKQKWIQKSYSGFLTITWVETVKTNNGYTYVHRSQTLTATIERPAPSYYYKTYLIYGNDAAPDLNFSRFESGLSGKSEKEIDKIVKREVKSLNKKAQKAVMNNESYTRFGNDEFEVLFGGDDRNNEVQYRLLFTPLAQKNLLELIKTPIPYGDDFSIVKRQKLNFVETQHSQKFDYYANPSKFVHYEYQYARKHFIEYMCDFFESFYFDIAPLMCIPLYQMTKARSYIYDQEPYANVSPYEYESVANSFSEKDLKPESADTPSILKTRFSEKIGEGDCIYVDAYAFKAEKRVTYVTMYGNDGHYHEVPVYWLEYIPIQKTTQMVIEKKDSSRFEFNCNINDEKFKNAVAKSANGNKCRYERGLLAMLLGKAMTAQDLNTINGLYKSGFSGNNSANEQIMQGIADESVADKHIDQSTIEVIEELESKLNDDDIEAEEVESTDEDEQSSDGDK